MFLERNKCCIGKVLDDRGEVAGSFYCKFFAPKFEV